MCGKNKDSLTDDGSKQERDPSQCYICVHNSLKDDLKFWSMSNSHILIEQGCHFPDNMKFPDFSRPIIKLYHEYQII